MLILSIILPLFGAVCAGFFGRFIGRSGSAFLTTIIMFINVILTVTLFCRVCMGSSNANILFIIGPWLFSDILQVNWGFYADNLTVIMLLVVNIVSALVHLYSTEYMANDPHLPRFMAYLSLFTFFMLLLVTGENFLILFLGWEGVGLCSYLLIGFWYTRVAANKAAIKAMIVNRVADFALTIGLIAIFFLFRSLDFHVVFPLAPFYTESTFNFFGYDLSVLFVICSLLFLGAMGKSAQIGLHTWLPDAMEGPTPVSALIHAATMVTAGVFLIIKCSPIFEYVPTIMSIIIFVGATTAFFAATVGLVQNDIKKVIAYSTCSQLGYMVFACGLSNYHVSLFHLANHAFFKALLFLSAGAIIHSISNEQDMRKFGALTRLLPFSSIMLLIGSLSLMGLPFLTGFYSKDLIIELAMTKYTIAGSFAYGLGLLTAFLTSFYSFRVFYLTFIYKNNSFKTAIVHAHELPFRMAFSLSVLSLGALFLGFLSKDLLVGLGTNFWSHSILVLPENNNQLDAEFFGLPNLDDYSLLSFYTENVTYQYRWVKLLPFFSSMLAIICVWFIFQGNVFPIIHNASSQLSISLAVRNRGYISMLGLSNQVWFKSYTDYMIKDTGGKRWREVYKFLTYKWYFDVVYNELINRPLLQFAYTSVFKLLDKGLLELFGPYGISSILFNVGYQVKRIHVGKMYIYANFIVLFLMVSFIVWEVISI